MKPILKVSLYAILSISLILSACSQKTRLALDATVAAINTSAAQTAVAQSLLLPTPIPPQPTNTPASTPTITSTAFPTATSSKKTTNYVTTSQCDDAVFMADVTFADNTVIAPDTDFEKIWSLKNSGTCTWNEDYSLVFVSGSSMDGETTSIDGTVLPGETIQIPVAMVSPDEDGTYSGYWRMMNDENVQFGVTVFVLIKVSSGVTSTPTLTTTPATETTTFTVTSTPTAYSTATTAPTSTVTATSIPLPTATPTADVTATETPESGSATP